ncbi:MAG: hypothetical protein VX836_19065 [Pseudomonadota bacterium]|nr:hypothetical protein [Pseudomonadota bacterium]
MKSVLAGIPMLLMVASCVSVEPQPNASEPVGVNAGAGSGLRLPPVSDMAAIKPDADGWYHYLQLSFKGPVENGQPNGDGLCKNDPRGLNGPCRFDHGVRMDATYLATVKSDISTQEQRRQNQVRENQRLEAQYRAEERARQEAVFAGVMGAAGSVASDYQAEQARQAAWEAETRAKAEDAYRQGEQQRQEQARQLAEARQQDQAYWQATQSRSSMASGSTLTASSAGDTGAGATSARTGPATGAGSATSTSTSAGAASTEDDPQLCVTSPVYVKNRNCPQGSAATITNRCELPVDARMCLWSNKGSWDCGASYGVGVGKDWTYSACSGTVDKTPFVSLRYSRSNQPLASP